MNRAVLYCLATHPLTSTLAVSVSCVLLTEPYKTPLGGKEIIYLTCIHRCLVDNQSKSKLIFTPHLLHPQPSAVSQLITQTKIPRSHHDPFLSLTMHNQFFRISWCLYRTCAHNHTSPSLSWEAAPIVSRLVTETLYL